MGQGPVGGEAWGRQSQLGLGEARSPREQEQGRRAPDERASAHCRGSGGGRPGRGQATAELGATAATGSRWKESDVRDGCIRRSPGDGNEPSRPSSVHCASFGSLPRTRQGESLRTGKKKKAERGRGERGAGEELRWSGGRARRRNCWRHTAARWDAVSSAGSSGSCVHGRIGKVEVGCGHRNEEARW